MKIVALIMISLTATGLYAQDASTRPKIYRTWIYLNSGFVINGSLYQVNDSSIVVSSSFRVQDYLDNRYEIFELPINNIETIKIRRNKSVGTGLWLGAISGFTIGFVVGHSTAENSFFSGSEVGFILGTPGAVAGAVLGAIVGSLKTNISIDGSIDTFNKNKERLKKYSIRK